MNATECLKLNLGSRDRSMPGFKNMDIDRHEGVDYIGDVSDLSRFADDSISEIFASNILEHFPHTRTLEVLMEWHRVIAPWGKLYLSVPDFARCAYIYKTYGMSPWLQNFIVGDQGYKTAFHYAIFDEKRLVALCKQAGFSKFERVKFFDFSSKKDCSNNVYTEDLKPISINAVVTKWPETAK